MSEDAATLLVLAWVFRVTLWVGSAVILGLVAWGLIELWRDYRYDKSICEEEHWKGR